MTAIENKMGDEIEWLAQAEMMRGQVGEHALLERVSRLFWASGLLDVYNDMLEGACYLADGVVVHNSPETTPGGRALKFYSSVRLDIRRVESIKSGAEVIGNRTRVKVVKNKTSPPFRQAEFDIMYSKGISREGTLLDVAVDLGIIKKSGAWYTYEGEQLGQGRENAKVFLSENLELMIEISERFRPQVGIGETVPFDVPLGQGAGDDEPISLAD